MRPKRLTMQARKSVGIESMLEVTQPDFERTIQGTRAAEKAAQDVFIHAQEESRDNDRKAESGETCEHFVEGCRGELGKEKKNELEAATVK